MRPKHLSKYSRKPDTVSSRMSTSVCDGGGFLFFSASRYLSRMALTGISAGSGTSRRFFDIFSQSSTKRDLRLSEMNIDAFGATCCSCDIDEPQLSHMNEKTSEKQEEGGGGRRDGKKPSPSDFVLLVASHALKWTNSDRHRLLTLQPLTLAFACKACSIWIYRRLQLHAVA